MRIGVIRAIIDIFPASVVFLLSVQSVVDLFGCGSVALELGDRLIKDGLSWVEKKATKNRLISRKERKRAKEIKQEDRHLLFVFFRFFRLKREFMLRFKCAIADPGVARNSPGRERC